MMTRLLVGLTLAGHLAFGLFYVLRAGPLPERPRWDARGEEFLRGFAGWETDAEGDAAAYNRAAVEALRGGVPRSRSGVVFLHAPLYAYFLAGCYGLGGVRLWSVAVPNAVLAAATCWLLIRVGRQLGGVRAGWWAGGLYLVNLRLAMYVGYVSPTHLLLFFFAVAIWAAAVGRAAVLAPAIVAGIATQAAFFVTAAATGLWALGRGWWERRRSLVVAGLVVGLAAGLKVVSNQIKSATPDHLRESARGILWEANNPNYESMRWWSLWERRPGNPWTRWEASPAEAARYAEYLARAGGEKARAGLLWVRENPGHYARLCLVRLRTTLGPFTGQMSPRNRAISTVFWLLIFPAGYWALWRRRREPLAQLAWLILAAVTVFETLVTTDWYLRYRLPVDLLMMVFAAQTYASWSHGQRASH